MSRDTVAVLERQVAALDAKLARARARAQRQEAARLKAMAPSERLEVAVRALTVAYLKGCVGMIDPTETPGALPQTDDDHRLATAVAQAYILTKRGKQMASAVMQVERTRAVNDAEPR